MTRAIAVLVVAVVAFAGCATTPSSDEVSPSSGSAPDFTLRDVDGRDVRLSDFEGRVVVLDFWATWCVPCEAAMPHLQTLFEKYKGQGLTILGVSMDGPETLSSVAPFARRYGLSFPVLLDVETKVTGIYNPKSAAPLSVFIGRDGRVAHTKQGFSAGDEADVEAEIVRLLSL